jgi:hypothetical protein
MLYYKSLLHLGPALSCNMSCTTFFPFAMVLVSSVINTWLTRVQLGIPWGLEMRHCAKYTYARASVMLDAVFTRHKMLMIACCTFCTVSVL